MSEPGIASLSKQDKVRANIGFGPNCRPCRTRAGKKPAGIVAGGRGGGKLFEAIVQAASTAFGSAIS